MLLPVVEMKGKNTYILYCVLLIEKLCQIILKICFICVIYTEMKKVVKKVSLKIAHLHHRHHLKKAVVTAQVVKMKAQVVKVIHHQARLHPHQARNLTVKDQSTKAKGKPKSQKDSILDSMVVFINN